MKEEVQYPLLGSATRLICEESFLRENPKLSKEGSIILLIVDLNL